MKLPSARNANILVQEAGKELLVYDVTINKAFNLNETAKLVYQACGDELTFEELKSQHQFTDDLIYLTLDGLKQNNLLADVNYVSPFAGLSRREVIKRVGLASMVALPMIAGIIAPSAVGAQSRTNGACVVDSDCSLNSPCFRDTCSNGQCTHTPKACPGKVCDPRDGVCKVCLNDDGCLAPRVCINGDCVTPAG